MERHADVLDDGDLRLRPITASDIPAISEQLSDLRVARWLAAVPHPFTSAAAEEVLAFGLHPGENLRMIEQAGAPLGGLCIGSSLWYWLTPDRWGEGHMRRALRMAITAHFARSAPPLIATCHVENAASRGLLGSFGFAPRPANRRMFFQSTRKAEPCKDYFLAPEQWHLLNPPEFTSGQTVLRPAQQKDTPALARMLPCARPDPWPDPEALPAFVEKHRFRGPVRGLFVIVDDNRRTVGMALIGKDGFSICFASPEDDARHRADAEIALSSRLDRVCRSSGVGDRPG